MDSGGDDQGDTRQVGGRGRNYVHIVCLGIKVSKGKNKLKSWEI